MYMLGVVLRCLKVKIYIVKIVKMKALDNSFVSIKFSNFPNFKFRECRNKNPLKTVETGIVGIVEAKRA